jgi:hypothetical protein
MANLKKDWNVEKRDKDAYFNTPRKNEQQHTH